MFLPVLIMREYGIAGWFVFAIPNVVGAAAVGWVLTDGQRAYDVALAHFSLKPGRVPPWGECGV